MTKFTRLHRTLSSILAAALTLSTAAPSYDRGGQALAVGNGAASSSRSHALKPTATAQSGLEEDLRERLLEVARAFVPQEPASPVSVRPEPLPAGRRVVEGRALSAAGLEESHLPKWPEVVQTFLTVYGTFREQHPAAPPLSNLESYMNPEAGNPNLSQVDSMLKAAEKYLKTISSDAERNTPLEGEISLAQALTAAQTAVDDALNEEPNQSGLEETSQVRWSTMVAKATGFTGGWTVDGLIKAWSLEDQLVIKFWAPSGRGNFRNVIETVQNSQYVLSVSDAIGRPTTWTSPEPIVQDIRYEIINEPNAKRVLTIFVSPRIPIPNKIADLITQADRFGSPQNVTLRITPAAGLEEAVNVSFDEVLSRVRGALDSHPPLNSIRIVGNKPGEGIEPVIQPYGQAPETVVSAIADGLRELFGLKAANALYSVRIEGREMVIAQPVHVIFSVGRTKAAPGVNDEWGLVGDPQNRPEALLWRDVPQARSEAVKAVQARVRAALEFHQINPDRLQQVGFAMTGFGDFNAGMLSMPNLKEHGFGEMLDLKSLFGQAFEAEFGRKISVIFVNDGFAGALGEYNLPEGALRGADGIFIILGGGVGSGELENGKPVYSVPDVTDVLNEIGWHLVTTDGGSTWVWRGEGARPDNLEALIPHPASGEQEWSLEQHMGGRFLAARAVAWMRDHGRGDVETFGEAIGIAQDTLPEELSRNHRPIVPDERQQEIVLQTMTNLGQAGDSVANQFIEGSGQALGRGLRAFRERFKGHAFARGRVAIGSTAGEKFGAGVDDRFLAAIRSAIGTEDVVRAIKTGVKREWAFSMPVKTVSTAGLEEPGIGSLPTTHEIDYRFSGQFLSGRIPTEEDAAQLLGTRGIPHAQLATEWIGVMTVLEELIGAGRGLDTVEKRGIVDRADIRAQEIQDQVALARSVLLQHVNFETKGLTPGGLKAKAVGGDPKGKPMPTISDVIEHTTAFVEGDPGASSMQMEGPGAETFGSFPDEARALMVVTHMDPAKAAAVLRQHGVQTVEELLDPELPVDQLVRRVAELNGVPSSQVDVTLLTSDDADLEALKNLQETYKGLRVHRVKAGTVAPSLAAVLGVNDKRVRLFLRRSGMTEAVFVTILAGLYSADGSYANFRVVSEEVKSEFARRYLWIQRVLKEMKGLRPDDWEEIRDGKKIFSSRQVTLPVTGAYTFLTNGRTDLELPFSVEGVRQNGGVSTISSLVFTSHPIYRGAGYLWLSRNSYTLPAPEVHQAGLEELQQALKELNARDVFWSAEEVDLGRQARPVLIDASEDSRLDRAALALSIVMAKDNVPEMDFRIVMPAARVPELLDQLKKAGAGNALPFLEPRIFTYAAVSTIGEVREAAVDQLARQFGFGDGLKLRQSGVLRVVSEWTPNLAVELQAFFTEGGLNFVSGEAYQRFEAVLKSA